MKISLNGGRTTPNRSISGTFHEVCSYWKLVICLDIHHFYIVYTPTIMPPKWRTSNRCLEAKLLRGSLDKIDRAGPRKNAISTATVCIKSRRGISKRRWSECRVNLNENLQSKFHGRIQSFWFTMVASQGLWIVLDEPRVQFCGAWWAALPSRNSRGPGEYLAPEVRHLLPATSGAQTFDEPDLVPFQTLHQ